MTLFQNKISLCCLWVLVCAAVLGVGFHSSRAADISAGYYHVAVLKDDGTLWVWGSNTDNQLGNQLLRNQSKPVNIALPGTGSEIAAGGYHTLLLLNDGTVASFGRNAEGQLGRKDGDETPARVEGLVDVIQVAAGGYHSLALKSDGTVWAWGANWDGAIGNGNQQAQIVPVKVEGLENVIDVVAGEYTSYALKSDGTVWAWGSNHTGQLGAGYKLPDQQLTPIQAVGLTGVVAITAGNYHACALKSDGSIWSWGDNNEGQAGTGDLWGHLAEPAQTMIINDAKAIAAGATHTVAVRSDGSIWAWGENFVGQLANGEIWPHTLMNIPQKSILNLNPLKIVAGGFTTFALYKDGTIAGFGSSLYGQMGDGQWGSYTIPVQAHEQRDGVKVIAGALHSLTAFRDGRIGKVGLYNQPIYRSSNESSSNRQTFKLDPLEHLAGVKQLSSGFNHSLALKSEGMVWSWGKGTQGQLGTGFYESVIGSNFWAPFIALTPARVDSLQDITYVAAGGNTSLAINAKGNIWTWGGNGSGQLGNGGGGNWNIPVRGGLEEGAIAAAIGHRHVVVLKKDGTVWAWGANESQQILSAEAWRYYVASRATEKNLTLNEFLRAAIITFAMRVPELTDVIAVAAGEDFSLALKSNGTVFAWGSNDYGQLGLGDWQLRSTPTLIPSLSNVVQIACGARHTIVRLADGTIKTWGANYYAQLGNGAWNGSAVPISVNSLKNIVDISAGYYFSMAVREDGSIWGWGNNSNEQLGVSMRRQHRPALRLTPNTLDTDEDGMFDQWERRFFQTLNRAGSLDFDEDGLTEIQEFLLGTDPLKPDTDGDGLTDIADDFPGDGTKDPIILPDTWQTRYFGQLGVDPDGDADNDGVSNLEEFLNNTNPRNSDTDNDGMSDGWEIAYGLNPNLYDRQGDADRDGVPNYRDARPNDPRIRELSIRIITPEHGSTF